MSCRLLNIEWSAAGSLSDYVLCDLGNNSWWAARRKFAGKVSILSGNVAEAPDATHVNSDRNFASSTVALDIETAAVPYAMTMAVLRTVRLSLWAMWLIPLWGEVALRDRQ